MMMHHCTKFGYKRLRGSEDIFRVKPQNTHSDFQYSPLPGDVGGGGG